MNETLIQALGMFTAYIIAYAAGTALPILVFLVACEKADLKILPSAMIMALTWVGVWAIMYRIAVIIG